jgi:tetratricopeptide (TPR) repeat protein
VGGAIVPIVDESGDEQRQQAGIGRILADAFVQIIVDIPGLYVIDRHRLESIAMSLGRPIDEASRDHSFARQVGEKAQAGAILSGTLSRLGEVYILSATLTEIPSDVVLNSFRGQSNSPEALLSELTGPVARELRQKYGAASEESGLDRVATASLDAYTHYVRGDDLIHEGNWHDATADLREAVRIDPEMALGWSALSCALSFAGDDTEARAAHLQATRFADRLNEQQRRWVELDGIWVNTTNGDLYLEAMERYKRDYPDDHRSDLFSGLAWHHLKKDCNRALASYHRAFSMLPNWYPITKARVDCLLELGRHAEARLALRDYLSLPYVGPHGRSKAGSLLHELEDGL